VQRNPRRPDAGNRRTEKMTTTTRPQADGYFGVCPICKNHDGYVNAGRTHVFVCDEHKVSWIAGANIFSDWREQTEDEQRQIYESRGVGDYQRIDPFYPATTLDVSGWVDDNGLTDWGEIPF
jgi:hypothetical protein